MEQNGPFWPDEVHFGPFRSANRALAIPELRCLELRFAAIRSDCTTRIARPKPFESLLRLYYSAPLREVSNRANRFASDSNR